jgi:hypothetical protein
MIMLSIKFAIFLALEVFVFALIGAVLLAGLYQLLRSKVRELGIAPAAAARSWRQ